jgi:acetyl-CoA acetyltransferase
MAKADVAIVGIGKTKPERRANKNVRALVVEAVQAAIDDAGIAAHEIDGIITDSVIMPQSVPREYVAAQFQMERRFDSALSYGGAANVAAPVHARLALESGAAKYVLYYFGLDWGSRVGGPYVFHNMYPAKLAFEKPYGYNAQPIYFALWATRYRHEYGLSEEDLAYVAVSHRQNAQLNPLSQMTKPLTTEGYYASPVLSSPLRIADSCLISDGAVAYIMTTMDRARDLRRSPVRILGEAFASEPINGDGVFTQQSDFFKVTAAAEAANRAFGQAGLSPVDVDLAQVYDCFTISCLLQVEALGFCKRGEGAAFLREKGIGVTDTFPSTRMAVFSRTATSWASSTSMKLSTNSVVRQVYRR